MPKAKVATNKKDPSRTPELDMMCMCCEALTRLLMKKGFLNWEELADMSKLVVEERGKWRHTVKSVE